MFGSNKHPFYPPSIPLKGYHEMTIPATYIFMFFGAAVASLIGFVWTLSGGPGRRVSTQERVLACWLMVTAAIHLVIEGYVVVTPDYYQHPADNYLSEAWKEYTKADSRYATRDSFIISMEAVTAFAVGPMCFAAVYGILQSKVWRFPLMIILSVCQIYGDVLYYGTCYLEGFVHSRPEVLYFWVYFVLLNALWILIPLMVLIFSLQKIMQALQKAKTD
jgi:cholestenol Delta-isomerase